MAVVNVQRTEQSQAVQYKVEDEADHGVIRGWLGAPELYPLADIESLVDGSWIVRERAGNVYQIDDSTFRSEFAVVVSS